MQATKERPVRRDPDSRYEDQARASVEHVDQCEAATAKAREDRDSWIRRMATEEGLTPPQIGRKIGMSTSMVRLVLR